MAVSFDCCVLSDRGHYVGPIIRPEESCRVWCAVPERDRESSMLRTPWPTGGCQAIVEGDLKTYITCFGYSKMGHGRFRA
jgi:hypothetical protein